MRKIAVILISLLCIQSASADSFSEEIKFFYLYYLNNILQDDSQNADLCKVYLTKELIEEVERAAAETGVDPIIRSQDVNEDAAETLSVGSLGGGWYLVSYYWTKGDESSKIEIPLKAEKINNEMIITYITPLLKGNQFGDYLLCRESDKEAPQCCQTKNIEQEVWGISPEGEIVTLYTLRNKDGGEVQLSNIGAGVISVTIPDRNGEFGDVVLGYDSFESYFGDGPLMGKTPGRYANRIAKGKFTLDGKEYQLPINSAPNHAHGGEKGFTNLIWQGRVEGNRVLFSLVSPDGDQGYPGELSVEVAYSWDNDYKLTIEYLANSTAPTIINLTNHAYFNLSGESSGSVLNQILQLNAERYLPTDDVQIPTGEYASVEGTPMDFRTPKRLGDEINADFEPLKIGKGYDHCWVVDGYIKGEIKRVGTLYDQESGRKLTIFSTQPGVQVYTGNYLLGSPAAKGGREYDNRDGVAIECQGFPDAPNKPNFPSQRLDPDDSFEQTIIYQFSVE